MKETLRRWALGVMAAVLALTIGTASAQGLWYKEAEKDGTIYVFNTSAKYEAWLKTGEFSSPMLFSNHGPHGETVLAENETAIDLFNLKHDLPGYDRPAPKPAAHAAPAAGESAPLQFKIGSTTVQPLGFMDFTGVYRNHNAGSGIGTNFGSIPYGERLPEPPERVPLQHAELPIRLPDRLGREEAPRDGLHGGGLPREHPGQGTSPSRATATCCGPASTSST